MSAALVTRMIFGFGQRSGDFAVALDLAIHDAQWIFFIALVAVGAEFAQALADFVFELFTVSGTAFGTAQGVDLQFQRRQ